jgi:hypothetical protein
MIEPMITRLVGCLVFGGLLAALVVTADASRLEPSRSDVVAAAQIEQRVQEILFTRP